MIELAHFTCVFLLVIWFLFFSFLIFNLIEISYLIYVSSSLVGRKVFIIGQNRFPILVVHVPQRPIGRSLPSLQDGL